jgi:hypothetical protein
MDKCALRRRRYFRGLTCFSQASLRTYAGARGGTRQELLESLGAESNASLIRRKIPGFMEKELVPKVSKNAQLNRGWFTDNEMHNLLEQLEEDKVRRFALAVKASATVFEGAQYFSDRMKTKQTKYLKEMLENRKTRFAWIYNKNGSHWVAVFFSLRRGVIEYFDSFGDEPVTGSFIAKHLNHMKTLFSTLIGKQVNIEYVNNYKLQTDGRECGPWSLVFVLSRANVIKGFDIKKRNTANERRALCRVVSTVRRGFFRPAPL